MSAVLLCFGNIFSGSCWRIKILFLRNEDFLILLFTTVNCLKKKTSYPSLDLGIPPVKEIKVRKERLSILKGEGAMNNKYFAGSQREAMCGCRLPLNCLG